MERKLLNLIPKRYLCPYCGEWHEWSKSHSLGDYKFFTAQFSCPLVERKLLNLIPERYICPYCGEWHEWSKSHSLWNYQFFPAQFSCDEHSRRRGFSNYSIIFSDFSDDYLYYYTDSICGIAEQAIKGKIPISSIVESSELPRVTFDVDFTVANEVGINQCSGCYFKWKCNVCRLGAQGDGRHMKITFGFEFDQSDYNSIAKAARKKKELQECEYAIDCF